MLLTLVVSSLVRLITYAGRLSVPIAEIVLEAVRTSHLSVARHLASYTLD